MGGNAVTVTEQMALIKPDDVDDDDYDRWYHKDTRVMYGTGSSVSLMLADFVSAGFDLSIMLMYYVSLMFLPQERSRTVAISQMKYKLTFPRRIPPLSSRLKVIVFIVYLRIYSSSTSTTVLCTSDANLSRSPIQIRVKLFQECYKLPNT